MYNLFVSGHKEDWESEPYFLELNRCLCEYTDAAITARYGDLTAGDIIELLRLPCIFAYESSCNKAPKFGRLRDLTKRQGKAKIEYETEELDKFLTGWDLEKNLAFELDILNWEMNRTHWAVKDIDLATELRSRDIILPPWARTATKAVDITKQEFDVALSFPGEIREFVRSVAVELESIIGPDSCFYDQNFTSQLAMPSLDDLLQDIYRNRSKLVVAFLCSDFQNKEWCGIEFRAIKEIIMERENKRVMYVRMDDGHVDGVLKTDGYIDGRDHNPADIARYIQQRVDLLNADN
ncbi:MAG: TIR domain-containing protein [candidate division Zixibacteria bacterium]|nr:TIR domain-containing protein [candidate division Zixibacteria bacterium]MDH3936276.1 TIR domain-containing protein [candidate division Zixibacteria bacterium]MDH4033651.1 TIR domain-containing protein [candidate division Zixibacteria bacterium]